jgi:hypothetical protein
MKCRYLGNNGVDILEITFGNRLRHPLPAGNGTATVIGPLSAQGRAQNKPSAAKEA